MEIHHSQEHIGRSLSTEQNLAHLVRAVLYNGTASVHGKNTRYPVVAPPSICSCPRNNLLKGIKQ